MMSKMTFIYLFIDLHMVIKLCHFAGHVCNICAKCETSARTDVLAVWLIISLAMADYLSDVLAGAGSETPRVPTTTDEDVTDDSDDSSSSVVENLVGSAGMLPERHQQSDNSGIITAGVMDVSINSQLSRVSSTGGCGQSSSLSSSSFSSTNYRPH